MEPEPLLKPMPRDALLRRTPAPSAASPASPPRLCEAPRDPACMRKPEFAPFPVRRAEPAEEALDDLLTKYLAEEEDDEPAADAVPTSLMPAPVCVPLFEEPKKRWWQKR